MRTIPGMTRNLFFSATDDSNSEMAKWRNNYQFIQYPCLRQAGSIQNPESST
jgi:hypothetical protein